MKTCSKLGVACLLCHAAFLKAEATSGPAPIASPSESIILSDAPIASSACFAAPEFKPAHLEATLIPASAGVTSQAHSRQNSRAWKLSLLGLAGASGADAISSWGKQESNPLLRSANGTFGLRGLMVKSGLTGASLIPQYTMHNNPKAQRAFTVLNFAETAVFTATAIHNFSIPAVKGVR